jgi:hypothetical protein
MPTVGEGYRAEYDDYRLVVEVDTDGWVAAVYDQTRTKWAWREPVASVEDGKRLAMEKLVDNVTPEQRQAILANGLEWQYYDPFRAQQK